jgi:hypothetical protein
VVEAAVAVLSQEEQPMGAPRSTAPMPA